MKFTRRYRHTPKHGQSLLINLLWRRFGGPKKVALLLDVPIYQPGNWDREGQVPIKYIGLVADKLGVPLWGLNYQAIKGLHYGETIPSWENVVKMYNFDKPTQAEILRLGEP